MPRVLATPYTAHLPNPSRLVFGVPEDDDEKEFFKVRMELRSALATNVGFGSLMVVVRNGTCTFHSRQTSPPVGLNANDPDRSFISTTREVPTGYTDLKSAIYNAANNANAKRVAWEAHIQSNHLDASLG